MFNSTYKTTVQALNERLRKKNRKLTVHVVRDLETVLTIEVDSLDIIKPDAVIEISEWQYENVDRREFHAYVKLP